MRLIAIFLAAIALMFFYGTARGDAPPATQPDTQVTTLLKDLAADPYTTREEAEKKLIAMGVDVEPQLRAALATNLPDESRQRLLGILAKIADNHRFGPTRITLHYHDQPLMTVLEDFARQASSDMGVHQKDFAAYVGDRRISIDLDKVDFWTALAKLGDIAAIRTSMDAEHPAKIVFSPNPQHYPSEFLPGRGCVVGAFYVYPCYASVVNAYSGSIDQPTPEVAVSVVAEPKVDVLAIDSTHWGKRCVDELGHVIPLTDGIGSGPMPWSIYYSVMRTELQETPGLGNRIVSLKGQPIVTVLESSDTVTLDDISQLHDLTKAYDGETVTLTSFSGADGKFKIHAEVSGANWGMAGAMEAGVQVLDAKGQPLKRGEQGAIEMRAGSPEVGMTLNFISRDPANIPVKLIWVIPSKTRKFSLPFELSHMELPHRPLGAPPATQPYLAVPATIPDAQMAELLRPSRITLHYHDAPLMSVLQDFQKQCEADLALDRMDLHDAGKTLISVDLDQADYWKAADALTKAAWNEQSEKGVRLNLPSRGRPGKINSVYGDCLIVPVTFSSRVQYAAGQGDNEASSLDFQTYVFFEPKLHVLVVDGKHWLREIVDENGNSTNAIDSSGGLYDGQFANLNTHIRQFPGMGGTIATLKGEINVEVAVGPPEVVRVDDLSTMKNLVKTVGDLSFTLHHFEKLDSGYKLTLSITGNVGEDWRSRIGKILGQIQFLDRQGNRVLGVTNWNQTSKSTSPLDIEVDRIGVVQTADSLRWEIFGKSKWITIPIELDNLPLPGVH